MFNHRALSKIMRILERHLLRWKQPVVGKYHDHPFLVLISCLLSLRTKDAVTETASKKLFSKAQSPQSLIKIPMSQIKDLIYPVAFYRVKSRQIHQICRILISSYREQIPNTIEELIKLPGVGRKTANLVLTEGFNKPGICVDTHVHRICNRWGYLKSKTPDQTEMILRQKLPRQYWIKLNNTLVAFGQNICLPVSPKCSQCPISQFCQRVNVKHQR